MFDEFLKGFGLIMFSIIVVSLLLIGIKFISDKFHSNSTKTSVEYSDPTSTKGISTDGTWAYARIYQNPYQYCAIKVNILICEKTQEGINFVNTKGLHQFTFYN